MRILHLLSTPTFSGPAEAVLLLARGQRTLGHEVQVAVDRKRAGTGSEEPVVPHFQREGLLAPPLLELSTKSWPLGVLRDLGALRRWPADVLHAHLSHDHWLARWGHPRGAVRVRSVHAPRSLRASMPRAQAFTVPMPSLLDRVRQHWPGVPTRVLPPLLDPRFMPAPDRRAAQARLGLEGAPLIGMVSTFQASRRHQLALEAFAVLLRERPSARLVLVGDGVLEVELRRRAASPDLAGRVSFAGYRKGEAFMAYLQAFDAVWVLGLGNDWSGRTAVQARRCGARVIAVDEGALGAWADVTLPAPDTAALVAATLSEARQAREVPSTSEVAREVIALYIEAGAEAGTPAAGAEPTGAGSRR